MYKTEKESILLGINLAPIYELIGARLLQI